VDITNHNTTLVWGHDAVSQHRIRQEQADTGSLVRSTRTQRRYVRAAHTVHEDRTAGIPPAPPTAMPRRPGFSQALARLTVLQRQVIQLRYLDGYPRDRTAAQMGRTLTSLRRLERSALRRLHAECPGNIARH
jgi:DNA-directed RNA polymerase specialized sigma24 family protein